MEYIKYYYPAKILENFLTISANDSERDRGQFTVIGRNHG